MNSQNGLWVTISIRLYVARPTWLHIGTFLEVTLEVEYSCPEIPHKPDSFSR